MTFKTTFKQKLIIRAALILALALILAASLLLSPDRVTGRRSAYSWLESASAAARVEITGAGGEGATTLIRNNGAWFVEYAGKEFPAKAGAVEDLFAALAAKGSYVRRGSAASSHERLKLTEEAASRITVSGGLGGAPLLDLLIGSSDATGKEVYYRKTGQDEVRSGSSAIAAFPDYSRASWYDLRIFPDSESLDLEQVYRVTVIAPPNAPPEEAADTAAAGETAAPLVIQRTGGGLTVEGLAPDETDAGRVETFVRQLLDTAADDYVPEMDAQEAVFNEGRILIEFSGLPSRIVRFGPPLAYNEEDGSVTRRSAVREGSPYVIALSSWNMGRLFRDRDYFKR
jgi:hypothetical protein